MRDNYSQNITSSCILKKGKHKSRYRPEFDGTLKPDKDQGDSSDIHETLYGGQFEQKCRKLPFPTDSNGSGYPKALKESKKLESERRKELRKKSFKILKEFKKTEKEKEMKLKKQQAEFKKFLKHKNIENKKIQMKMERQEKLKEKLRKKERKEKYKILSTRLKMQCDCMSHPNLSNLLSDSDVEIPQLLRRKRSETLKRNKHATTQIDKKTSQWNKQDHTVVNEMTSVSIKSPVSTKTESVMTDPVSIREISAYVSEKRNDEENPKDAKQYEKKKEENCSNEIRVYKTCGSNASAIQKNVSFEKRLVFKDDLKSLHQEIKTGSNKKRKNVSFEKTIVFNDDLKSLHQEMKTESNRKRKSKKPNKRDKRAGTPFVEPTSLTKRSDDRADKLVARGRMAGGPDVDLITVKIRSNDETNRPAGRDRAGEAYEDETVNVHSDRETTRLIDKALKRRSRILRDCSYRRPGHRKRSPSI